MPWKSLGVIAVPSPGTPVWSASLVAPTAAFGQNQVYYAALAIMFQADPSNTGKVYIGDRKDFDKTGRTGLTGRLAVLGVPTENIIQSASASIPNAPAGLNAVEYWIDADVSGDGATVSVLYG